MDALGTSRPPRPTGSPRVWEVIQSDRRFFVKRCASRTAYQRETYAYRNVLRGLDAACTPRLVASSERRLALIMTAVPGIPVSHARMPVTSRVDIYRRAGAVLAQLHAHQPSPHAWATARTSLTQAADAAERLLDTGRPCLSEKEEEFARQRVKHLRDAKPLLTGFIHGDPHEGNWIRSAGGPLALVDYANSRHASVVHDLVPLACRWIDLPLLRSSFYEGYGQRISTAERHMLVSLITLRAVNRLTRGVFEGNEAHVRSGRRLLARMIKGTKI
ncbi:aminoglycoside phosphotransferase family protein [Streptomyces acidiscabies]|nr:aminoglycoside phosphotransferase family protein [Streptomyces acidiscabies]